MFLFARDGYEDGIEKGREEERIRTEEQRARADEAEAEVKEAKEEAAMYKKLLEKSGIKV